MEQAEAKVEEVKEEIKAVRFTPKMVTVLRAMKSQYEQNVLRYCEAAMDGMGLNGNYIADINGMQFIPKPEGPAK